MLTNPKPAGWTNAVDTITAAQIGSIATQLPNALDAIGGGTYAPAVDITMSAGGGALNLNCNVVHGGTSTTTIGSTASLTLAGTTNWLLVGSRTVTIICPFQLLTVVQGVGPGAAYPSARIADSATTSTIGGLTVASGSIISPLSSASAVQASYSILEIPRPPNGQRLLSVTLKTIGVSGTPTTFPYYTMVTVAPGGAPVAVGTVDVIDTHIAGNWTTTILDQILVPTAPLTVDTSTQRYGVLVKNPFDVGIGASFRVLSVVASYNVTSLQT